MTEIKILHIHKGKDEDSNFIEFMNLHNGKNWMLQQRGFIKRYGTEHIEAFKSTQE